MQSGGSVSPSVVRPAGRPARRSAPRKGTTRAMAVVAAAVEAEGTPPADTAAADRIPRAVAATHPAVAGIHPAAGVTPVDRARCIRRSARNVAGIPKSPSSLARTSRSIAGSASSCDGRRRLRAITTTRTLNSPERGGRRAAPFSIGLQADRPGAQGAAARRRSRSLRPRLCWDLVAPNVLRFTSEDVVREIAARTTENGAFHVPPEAATVCGWSRLI